MDQAMEDLEVALRDVIRHLSHHDQVDGSSTGGLIARSFPEADRKPDSEAYCMRTGVLFQGCGPEPMNGNGCVRMEPLPSEWFRHAIGEEKTDFGFQIN